MGGYIFPNGEGCGPGFDSAVFELCQAVGSKDPNSSQWQGLWGMPAYWNNTLYFWASGDEGYPGDNLKAFPLINNGTTLTLGSPVKSNAVQTYPGAGLSISSNGNMNGIVWALSNNGGGAAELRAYDANAVNTPPLYSSSDAGGYVRFSVPTVVAGKVYVGAQNQLTVYGLGTPNASRLIVNKGGTGAGTVTSNPAGINCGSVCSVVASTGTPVTLTATPDAGVTLVGWSGGGCSGTNSCTVPMNTATTVTATFSSSPPPPRCCWRDCRTRSRTPRASATGSCRRRAWSAQ